jgi:hypothetical protein
LILFDYAAILSGQTELAGDIAINLVVPGCQFGEGSFGPSEEHRITDLCVILDISSLSKISTAEVCLTANSARA